MDEAAGRDFVAARGSSIAMEKLDKFEELLRVEALRQNLISSSTLGSIWVRHFADSAQIMDNVSRETPSLLDLGSGAGLPGIVLALLRPKLAVTLVESRKLRINWLQYVADELDCSNVRVIGLPISEVPTSGFGAITARAFAPLDKLLQLAARFSTPDTDWVLPKGRSAAQEVAQLPPNLHRMFHVKPSMTDSDAGIIIAKGRVII